MAVTFVDAVDVKAMLKAPDQRNAEIKRPAEWAEWNEAFKKIRDTINKFLDVVDKVPGIDITMRLPGGDLEDLVVKPFTGDWNRIRMNGDACKVWGQSVQGLSQNVAKLPKDMALHWYGKTALAFDAHHVAYAVVMKGIGMILEKGELLFSKMGDMSQKLGEVAIRVLTKLGKILLRVIGRILEKFAGWWAAIKTAAEVVVNGLQPVIDIYNDIVKIIDLVGKLFELKDKVVAWVEDKVAKLKLFSELPHMIENLPNLTAVRLPDAPAVDPNLQSTVNSQVNNTDPSATTAADTGLEGTISSADSVAT